jgi:5-bromo-4-chloroindolyl phosphate hydrolysis protein
MGFIFFFGILSGTIIIITLGSIWLGTSYSAKKKGLVKGATRREIEQIQRDISQIREDIAELKEQIADLTTITRDSL